MPQQRGPGLSLAEWLVLCLISEGPTHGFAIACLLARRRQPGPGLACAEGRWSTAPRGGWSTSA